MLRVLSCCDRGLLVLGAVLKNKIHFSFLESFFLHFLVTSVLSGYRNPGSKNCGVWIQREQAFQFSALLEDASCNGL